MPEFKKNKKGGRMRCPLLEELPPPPPGKTGWPWTEGSKVLPERMANGSEWPKISIVTPNYNYERYLEATIRSVLLQGYPNIEYIIQDDGSTDGSVALIKRYEKYLAYWSSEPNCGQPAVINRGLHRSTGSILAYINSDDLYSPNAFGVAATTFQENPDVDFINGRCAFVDEYGNKIQEQERFGDITRFDEVVDLWNVWWKKRNYVQPETFWRRRLWERVGDFRNDLYIVFDYEYWCRMFLAGAIVRPVPAELACFRLHPIQKTKNTKRAIDEELAVIRDWLWDPATPISDDKRRLLQGYWLFEHKFRNAGDSSLARGESVFYRWFQLLGIAIRHPQIWSVPEFQYRLKGLGKRIVGRARS